MKITWPRTTLSFFILRFFTTPACKIPVKPLKYLGWIISRKEKSFHRNWKSLARGQIRDIPAPWSFILTSSLFFLYLALLGYAFHAPLLKSCRLIASRGDEHLMIFVVGIVIAPLRLSQQFSCLKLRWLESWYRVIFKITFRLTKNHYKKHQFNKLKAKIMSNIPLEFTCYTNPNGNLKSILMVE
jgi:hypothetical protein